MATPTRAESQMTCPQCGKTIAVDDRFVKWCEYCGWGMDPAGHVSETARERRRREAARKKGERLLAELKQSAVTRPSRGTAGSAAFVIAVLIHTVTIAILALGIYVLVTNFPSFFGFVVGGLLILLFVLIRPRLGGVARGTVILPPDHAPTLYAVTSRIAGEMGARPVQLIALDAKFNASHGQVGIRGQRVLWVGLALWNVLDDRQRIALLSHELAHQVNGDLSFGMVVGSALRTLDAWHRTLRPAPLTRGGGGLAGFTGYIAQLLTRLLYSVLRRLVELIFDLEKSLLFRSSQRAEYFADRVAAGVASTAAMLECLDVLHLSREAALAVRYAAQRDEKDVWESERRFFKDLSPKEWERLRRLDALNGTSIDTTHPPTSTRIDPLESGPREPGSVDITDAESSAIAAEMASGFDLVGQQIQARFASQA